ncbi:deaminase domain-containing protein [Pseudomonas typographi]|uniref:deaminase domain-containing protein n=1 Tax=Pseudomonas typographi TaxID=2715964 RepID=UPI001683166E|nr:deaminase domain-containing protein [Pseudomonas typographi]MBD1554624.1 hypothetical protein [Pseudomonas typographi]
MPIPDYPQPWRQQLEQLSIRHILLPSGVAAPDPAWSLNEHFARALGTPSNFPQHLQDASILAELNNRLSTDAAGRYVCQFLDAATPSGLDLALRANFFKRLSQCVVEHLTPGGLGALQPSPKLDSGYRTADLAQQLWAQGLCLRPQQAFYMAAFLLYETLPSRPSPASATARPAPPLMLKDYLRLDELAAQLLGEGTLEATAWQMFTQLGAEVYCLNPLQRRPPTQKEREAGVAVNKYGEAFITGEALRHPAAHVLEAILASNAFQQWQHTLVRAAEWYEGAEAEPMNRALAEQALIDTLYPPPSREPGYLLGFELFTAQNAHYPLGEIRIDLCNHLRQTLQCRTGVAQLAAYLLMRRFAPELLIDDAPEQFCYQPDLRWANLQHGARLLQAERQPLTFAAAEQAPARATGGQQQYAAVLNETNLLWAQLNGVLPAQGPYTDAALLHAYRRFHVAWALELLRELPDRVAQARQWLLEAGIAPDGRDVDNQPYIEAYLDGEHHRLPAEQRGALQDVNAWFDERFAAYTQRAKKTYAEVFDVCLQAMHSTDRQRLEELPWIAYGVAWPRYIGPSTAVPSLGSSPEDDWAYDTAAEGLMIHAQGASADYLYEVFPERLTYRVHTVTDSRERELLANPAAQVPRLLALPYADYNGTPLPWNVSDFARCTPIVAAPANRRLPTLAQQYAADVALAHLGALRMVCKGATLREITQAKHLQGSVWGYLWRLLQRTLPLVGCLGVSSGGDAAHCVLDITGPVAGLFKVGGRIIRPLSKLRKHPAQVSPTAYLDSQRIARVWANARLGAAAPLADQRHLGPRRWSSEPALPGHRAQATHAEVDGTAQFVVADANGDLRMLDRLNNAPFGPRLTPLQAQAEGEPLRLLTTQRQLRNGQAPGALEFTLGPDGLPRMRLGGQRDPVMVVRDAHTIDLIIDGEPYRFHRGQTGNLLRHVQYEPLLGSATRDGQPIATVNSSTGPGQPSITLTFGRPANDTGTPPFGQLVSRAFGTVRIETAPMRFKAHDLNEHQWASVFVREGKCFHYSDEIIPAKGRQPARRTGRKIPQVLSTDEAPIRLGVIAPPAYHRQIIAELVPDLWFGLPANLSLGAATLAARFCPVLRLHGLAKSVFDRRTLRGAVIDWQGENWLFVEADLGILYGTRYHVPTWLQEQLSALANTGRPLLQGPVPVSTRLQLKRVRDDSAVRAYLDVSESYRIVAGRRHLQRDIDNLTELLRDWRDRGKALMPANNSPFLEFLLSAQARLLPEYAKNILTRVGPQDALTGLVRQGVAGLNKEIIPVWRHFRACTPGQRQHIVGVLQQLLPATGKVGTLYTPLSAATLGTAQGAETLRKHLTGANLAFASITLRDGQRRVYFSLSGGKSKRKLELANPPSIDQPRIEYIDARARMNGQAPDPRFTDLPVLRRPGDLTPRTHDRHLDSERLIATVINQDLLAQAQAVERIDVFTLLDACRSCGGFVLPRLRLDYYRAQFSMTYLLDYGR